MEKKKKLNKMGEWLAKHKPLIDLSDFTEQEKKNWLRAVLK